MIGNWIYIVRGTCLFLCGREMDRVSVISRKAKGQSRIKRASNYLHEKCPNIHT
jgi:hypothetical protein